MDAESYFLEVCRYVDLNPVRARMVKRSRDWVWSSYRAHTGQVALAAWLDSRALHRQLAPHAPLRDGPAKYAAFVAQGKGVNLWEEALQGQIYLGNDAFVKCMQKRMSAAPGVEIPLAQRRRAAKPLAHYFSQAERDVAIVQAYRDGGGVVGFTSEQVDCGA